MWGLAMNKPITFRPTDDSQDALVFLLNYYHKDFPGISKADIINKAIIKLADEIAKRTEAQTKSLNN
jgi:hypothetical protein